MSHRYKLRYRMERKPEGISKEEATAAAKDGWGACDAALICSIIFPEDGSYSLYFIGEDGRTDTVLDDHEWFKVWTLLAKRLGESKTLPADRARFAADVFKRFCAQFMRRPD